MQLEQSLEERLLDTTGRISALRSDLDRLSRCEPGPIPIVAPQDDLDERLANLRRELQSTLGSEAVQHVCQAGRLLEDALTSKLESEMDHLQDLLASEIEQHVTHAVEHRAFRLQGHAPPLA